MAPASKQTHSLAIFLEAVSAIRAGVAMKPRSASDKEYFAQDWFIDRLRATGLSYQQQGRNRYPDFWVSHAALREGYEVKSLAFVPATLRPRGPARTGRPARRDLDFNSTIPSGNKGGEDVFLLFLLYTGSGAADRPLHTLCLAHADLINSDHAVADLHVNIAIKAFGSYGDGFIRNRKMYVFPHPVEIDPSGLGRCRLIAPASWHLTDARLTRVGTLQRTIAQRSVTGYTVSLHGARPTIRRKAYANAGGQLAFDVFEAV
jgi:hypothetical protein